MRIQRNHLAMGFGILSFFIYFFLSRYSGTWDCLPSSILPLALLRGGSLDFNSLPDFTFDSNHGLRYCFMEFGGRIVSSYPIVPGILHVPVVFAAKLLGISPELHVDRLAHLTSSLIAAASVSLTFVICARICSRVQPAIVLTLAFAFATCNWSVNATGLWQHGPCIFFILASILLVQSKRLSAAALMLGLAVATRPVSALLVLPIASVLFLECRNWKPKWTFALAFLLPIGLIFVYSHFYLDSALRFGQGHTFRRFNVNPLVGFLGLTVSPNRGLFFFSPFLIWVFPALVLSWKHRKSTYFGLACGLGVFLFTLTCSTWENWWGGHSFGYRLLIEILPFSILLLAHQWDSLFRGSKKMKVAFYTTVLLSVFTHVIGARIYPSTFNAEPVGIDDTSWRIWDLRDGEIARCINELRHSR